jgi:hypothetical protein
VSLRQLGTEVLTAPAHSRVSSITTEKPISRVAAAAMVGLRFSRMPLNICRGRVACSGPARNRVTTTSSNEVAKANSAPEITPGAISGRVTRKNAVTGGAPRLAAARTRL